MFRLPPSFTLFPTRRSSDLLLERPSEIKFVVDLVRNQGSSGIGGLISRPTTWPEIFQGAPIRRHAMAIDRKSTRLNSSHVNLVCRLLLEKKKKHKKTTYIQT